MGFLGLRLYGQVNGNPKKEKEKNIHLKKNVSFQANLGISYQRFSRPPEVGVLRCHRQTDKQTDGHSKSMTESA